MKHHFGVDLQTYSGSTILSPKGYGDLLGLGFRALVNSFNIRPPGPGPPQVAGFRDTFQLSITNKRLWLFPGFPRFGQVRDLDPLSAYLQPTAHPRLSKQPVIFVCPLVRVPQGHQHQHRAISSQMTILMDVVCSLS